MGGGPPWERERVNRLAGVPSPSPARQPSAILNQVVGVGVSKHEIESRSEATHAEGHAGHVGHAGHAGRAAGHAADMPPLHSFADNDWTLGELGWDFQVGCTSSCMSGGTGCLDSSRLHQSACLNDPNPACDAST